jgi:hypothetical protein
MIQVPPKPDSYTPIFKRILSSVSFLYTGERLTFLLYRTRRRLPPLIPGSGVDRMCNPESNVPYLRTYPKEDYP